MNKKFTKIAITALFIGIWLRVFEKVYNLNLIPEWLHKPIFSIGAIIGSVAIGGYLSSVLQNRLTNERKNELISKLELDILKFGIYAWMIFTSLASIVLIHSLQNAETILPTIAIFEFGLILVIFRGLLMVNMEYKISEVISMILLLSIVSFSIYAAAYMLGDMFKSSSNSGF